MTFSGDRALAFGQDVLYITERGVFERSAHSDVLELIEVAPGIDIERDILPHMDFEPHISPNLKVNIHVLDAMCITSTAACLDRTLGDLNDCCVCHGM